MPENETDLRQRIKEGSSDLDDYIDLADLLFKSHRREETLAILQKASVLDLTPVHRGILLNEQAGFSYAIARPKEETLKLAEQALSFLGERPRSPQSALSEAQAAGLICELLWDTDQTAANEAASRALSAVDDAIKSHSNIDPAVLLQLFHRASRVHSVIGQSEDAIKWIRMALAQPFESAEPVRIDYLIDFGRLLRTADRIEEAKGAFDEALKAVSARSAPRDPDEEIQEKDLSFEIGALCSERGEHLEAIETYRKLLGTLAESDPDYWTCLLYLAICEGALRRYEDAREHLRTILASEAAPPETRDSASQELFRTRYGLAYLNYEAQKFAPSIFELESLLSEKLRDEKLHCDILLTLGHAYCWLKRYLEARKCYEDLIGVASAFQDGSNETRQHLLSIRYYIALCDYETARHEASIAELESLLSEELDDDDLRSRSLLLLGNAHLASKAYLQAQRCYGDVIISGSATPDQRNTAKRLIVKIRYDMAVQDHVEAKYEAAIPQFESLLQEELEGDTRIRSLMWLGHAYAHTRRYEQARKCYEDVAKSASITQEQRDKAKEFLGRLPEPRLTPMPPERVN